MSTVSLSTNSTEKCYPQTHTLTHTEKAFVAEGSDLCPPAQMQSPPYTHKYIYIYIYIYVYFIYIYIYIIPIRLRQRSAPCHAALARRRQRLPAPGDLSAETCREVPNLGAPGGCGVESWCPRGWFKGKLEGNHTCWACHMVVFVLEVRCSKIA